MKLLSAADGQRVGYGSSEFTRALGILEGGGSINYDGVSGSLDHNLSAKNAVASPLARWSVVGGEIVMQGL